MLFRSLMPLYISDTTGPPQGDAAGAAWWETPYGRWRLAAEGDAMRRFPGFTAALSENECLTWTGWLRSGLNRGRRYLVHVTYPNEFPDRAPVVTIAKPALPSEAPHLLPGNRPCLYRSGDGYENGYDPAATTAATLVAWTALWIHAFESWRATGVWPGMET